MLRAFSTRARRRVRPSRRLPASAVALTLALPGIVGLMPQAHAQKTAPVKMQSVRGIGDDIGHGRRIIDIGHPKKAVLNLQGILTQHMDNARTGHFTGETFLNPRPYSATGNPGGVSPSSFGKLYTRFVDGTIIGQPLYVSNVNVKNQFTGAIIRHNLIIAATNRNNIYAFDADSNLGTNSGPVWFLGYTFALGEVNPVPSVDIPTDEITPEIGIVGTPAIDSETGLLYVVVRTKVFNDYHQELHAIDITSGLESVNSPVEISASVPGFGDGQLGGSGNITFDSLYENQRAALLVTGSGINKTVYVTYGGHSNRPPYHGWVIGFDATSLQQTQAFCTSPNATNPYQGTGDFYSGLPVGAGIHQSGGGPAADSAGNLYAVGGIGIPDVVGQQSYGETFFKLAPDLSPVSSYTVDGATDLQASLIDQSTGGITLFDTTQVAGHSHLAVSAGQDGALYLLDRDNLASPVNRLDSALGPVYGTPAYLASNGQVYFHGAGDVLKSFSVGDQTTITGATSIAQFGQASATFAYPGASPVLSSSNGQDAIVWEVEAYYPPAGIATPDTRPPYAVLRAYDANDLTKQLYNGAARGTAELAGGYVNFMTPTVADGRCYLGGVNQITVFGPKTTAPANQPDQFLILGGIDYSTTWIEGIGTPNKDSYSVPRAATDLPNYREFHQFSKNNPHINSKGVGRFGNDASTPPVSGGIFPAYAQGQNNSFLVVPLDITGKPTNLTYDLSRPQSRVSATLYSAFFNPISLGALFFNNQSQYVLQRPFAQGYGFAFMQVQDAGGHLGQATFQVNPSSTSGFDHYALRCSTSVQEGTDAQLTVLSYTLNNTPFRQNDNLAIYDTIPGGYQTDAPIESFTTTEQLIPGYAYEGQYAFFDNYIPGLDFPRDRFKNNIKGDASLPSNGVAPRGLAFNGSSLTVPIRMFGKGQHVVVVYSLNTGSVATITVTIR